VGFLQDFLHCRPGQKAIQPRARASLMQKPNSSAVVLLTVAESLTFDATMSAHLSSTINTDSMIYWLQPKASDANQRTIPGVS
jgi:hypothetical protein